MIIDTRKIETPVLTCVPKPLKAPYRITDDGRLLTLYDEIREQFHKEEAKLLLINPWMTPNDYWYNINKESNIHSTGFCYLASEVYYHQTGKAKKWWFKELKSDQLPYNGYHYFLQHKETEEIIDLTSDQFGDIVIPYHEAKNRGIRFESKAYKKFLKLMEK